MKLLDAIWPFRKTQSDADSGTDAVLNEFATSSVTAGSRSSVTDDGQGETSHAHVTSPMHCVPTAYHARQLLESLVRGGFEDKELIVSDLQGFYAKMCHELNWRPQPWNPLANLFRRLTTGDKKTYRTFR